MRKGNSLRALVKKGKGVGNLGMEEGISFNGGAGIGEGPADPLMRNMR
jgi:hypothetical protein